MFFPLFYHPVPQLFHLAFIPYSKGSKRNARLPNDPPKGGFTLLSINMPVCLFHLDVSPPIFYLSPLSVSCCLLLCPVLLLLSVAHNPFISLCVSLPLCVTGYSGIVLLPVLCPQVTAEGRIFRLVLGSKHVI